MTPHIWAITRRKGGFTLIELLVVIGIITLLAAILFPVFGRARENARRSSCQSNLKQWGLAMAQYDEDYDEFKVINDLSGGGLNPPALWPTPLIPYVKSYQIAVCPSDTTPLTAWSPYTKGLSYTILQGAFSVVNSGAAGYSVANPYVEAIREVNFEWPSEYVVLGDLRTRINNPDGSFYSPGGPTTAPYQEDEPTKPYASGGDDRIPGAGTSYRFGYRHLEGANFLFADGHVKWAKIGGLRKRNLWRDKLTCWDGSDPYRKNMPTGSALNAYNAFTCP